MSEYLTKVSTVKVGEDQEYLSFEVPPEFIKEMKLVDGEVLKWIVEADVVTITKTNIID